MNEKNKTGDTFPQMIERSLAEFDRAFWPANAGCESTQAAIHALHISRGEIVRAVNSHEAMREALTNAARWLESVAELADTAATCRDMTLQEIANLRDASRVAAVHARSALAAIESCPADSPEFAALRAEMEARNLDYHLANGGAA